MAVSDCFSYVIVRRSTPSNWLSCILTWSVRMLSLHYTRTHDQKRKIRGQLIRGHITKRSYQRHRTITFKVRRLTIWLFLYNFRWRPTSVNRTVTQPRKSWTEPKRTENPVSPQRHMRTPKLRWLRNRPCTRKCTPHFAWPGGGMNSTVFSLF